MLEPTDIYTSDPFMPTYDTKRLELGLRTPGEADLLSMTSLFVVFPARDEKASTEDVMRRWTDNVILPSFLPSLQDYFVDRPLYESYSQIRAGDRGPRSCYVPDGKLSEIWKRMVKLADKEESGDFRNMLPVIRGYLLVGRADYSTFDERWSHLRGLIFQALTIDDVAVHTLNIRADCRLGLWNERDVDNRAQSKPQMLSGVSDAQPNDPSAKMDKASKKFRK